MKCHKQKSRDHLVKKNDTKMKNNKTNLEKQIKKRTKINPPHLKEFLEELLPAYIKKLKNIDIISIADRVFSEYIRLSNATDE